MQNLLPIELSSTGKLVIETETVFAPGGKYVYFFCKVGYFNMGVYGDWLTFETSLKWPFKELPFLALWLHFSSGLCWTFWNLSRCGGQTKLFLCTVQISTTNICKKNLHTYVNLLLMLSLKLSGLRWSMYWCRRETPACASRFTDQQRTKTTSLFQSLNWCFQCCWVFFSHSYAHIFNFYGITKDNKTISFITKSPTTVINCQHRPKKKKKLHSTSLAGTEHKGLCEPLLRIRKVG